MTSHPGPRPAPQSASEAFGDVATHLVRLMRHEMALARAEVADNLGQARKALILVIVGGVLALIALLTLTAALVAALAAAGLGVGWAALAVGAGIALLGGLFLMLGLRDLRLARIMPERAMESLQRDGDLIREKLHVRA